ncbi:hypothetical protein ACFLRC_05010, partial [Candidatus Altiarchaeota archaeon]
KKEGQERANHYTLSSDFSAHGGYNPAHHEILHMILLDLHSDGNISLTDKGKDLGLGPYVPEEDVRYTLYYMFAVVIIGFICALISVLLVEGIFLWIYTFWRKIKFSLRLLTSFIVANCISLPIFWILFDLALILGKFELIFAEFCIILFEAYFIYHFNKETLSMKDCLAASLLMNIASATMGLFIYLPMIDYFVSPLVAP